MRLIKAPYSVQASLWDRMMDNLSESDQITVLCQVELARVYGHYSPDRASYRRSLRRR